MKRRSFFKSLLPALSVPFIFDYVFSNHNKAETESAILKRVHSVLFNSSGEIYFSEDGITWEKELSGKANVIHRYKEGYWDMWEIPKGAFKNQES